MAHPNFIILYVADPIASATFYANLLGTQPVEAAPTFALFNLQSGLMLGLWARDTVEPAASLMGGGAEIAVAVESDQIVSKMHADWAALGLPIAQAPTRMDFGYTFVALDPDGHRIRVFAAR